MSEARYDLPDPQLLIVLDPPIKRDDGGTVTEILLREPTAGQVRAAESNLRNGINPQSLREYQLSLVAAVSGISRKVIDQVPIHQLVEGADYLQNFITPPPKTGSS